MTYLCRDCFDTWDDAALARCPGCGSRRTVGHAELERLGVAHLDCDAFYAAIETRDNPALAEKPLIVGGGKRGVVSTCCYQARKFGVRSAMPMFRARALCPQANVVFPDHAKYAREAKRIRAILDSYTPAIEPLSIDEAFIDLRGTEAVHGQAPAVTLAAMARRIEDDIGITVSIGLSYNKFLAKIASELDKPRGFAVIGEGEARQFLADKPVSLIFGVGKVTRARLERDGFATIGALATVSEIELVRRYGKFGHRLAALARGEDARAVEPDRDSKGLSAETTFDEDIAAFDRLRTVLWDLSEKVAGRLKRANYAGRVVVLKLKTARFKLLTRRRTLAEPTQWADAIFRTAEQLLEREAKGTRFRLIGVGVADVVAADSVRELSLLDPKATQRAEVEQAIDRVRSKFGFAAIGKGRGLARRKRPVPGKSGRPRA